eukprot:2207901-Lingulodinium_polyedra.AAC.1
MGRLEIHELAWGPRPEIGGGGYAGGQYSDKKSPGIIKIVVNADSAGESPMDAMRKGALNAMTPQEEILVPYLARAKDMKT